MPDQSKLATFFQDYKWYLLFAALAIAVVVFVVFYKRSESFAPFPQVLADKLGLSLPRQEWAPKLAPIQDAMDLGVKPTPGARMSSDRLEPPKANVDWIEMAPPDADLKGQNFLEPQQFIGVDTVAGSLKNANYDIRKAPPNPRVDTGPWLQSTYDADPFRKPLE